MALGIGNSDDGSQARCRDEEQARGHLQAEGLLSKVDGGVVCAGHVDDGGEDACQLGAVAQLRPARLVSVPMPHIPAHVNVA